MSKTITIVIPCLNEEKVIGDVIKDCWTGLKHDKKHQILIMDSSTDKSGEIAKSLGADVVKETKKGLGQAYLDSIPHIKGDYVFMGDADGTYDFKEIGDFVKKLDKGYEFIMGTRMKGWIEKGAMPKLHQYFGTPFTTWILNKLFKLNFSDIHCGLRALTKKALIKIDLKSKSWEYASEMVVKAGLLKLKKSEVPIHFYRDKKGRVSHHKRMGWFSPWYAGWINLKIMLLYAPNFVFFIPGFLSLVLGTALVTFSILGIFDNFKYHSIFLGFVLVQIGYLTIQLGVISKLFSDLEKYYKRGFLVWFEKEFNYNKGMIIGGVAVFLGILSGIYFIFQWIENNYRLFSISSYGIFGMLLLTLGFQTIFFTFIYEVLRISKEK